MPGREKGKNQGAVTGGWSMCAENKSKAGGTAYGEADQAVQGLVSLIKDLSRYPKAN